MISDSEAAALSLFVMYAMDQYLADPTNLAPSPDPRLSSWQVVGYLTAMDCVLRSGAAAKQGDERCYGYLAESLDAPGTFVAAIRGTNGIIEWIEDAEFSSVPHPTAGKVESGFWGIYASMSYRPIGQCGSMPTVMAASGIAAAVGSGSLTVIGHSLGAPLAAYLTFDLAAIDLLGDRVQGCFFASPRPGDQIFARALDARVKTYRVYNYDLDIVPRVPVGPDYCDLLRVQWITLENSQARIGFSPGCGHHLACYAAQLGFKLLDWRSLPGQDAQYAACIKGPRI